MENKTLILHDTFLYKWGGERLILLMAKVLDTDLASGFFDKWSYDLREQWFEWKMIEISSPIFKKWFRHIKLKWAFLFKTKFLKDYKNVIFSWDCLGAVRNCPKNVKKYYYCHTPPRYIFDQKEVYLSKVPLLIRPIYLILLKLFKNMYLSDISKMDVIFTNSKTTQARIKFFTWYDAEIIYPPVDITFFKPSEIRKEYYFSYARLSEIKRVDKIVAAFMQMPDKELVFAYWKNDPEKWKILKSVEWYNNITPIESPSDDELRKLIRESVATIYIPVNEDFGMSPVESMACGVPVIWVNDWWLKETVSDWETWILIWKEAKVKDIKAAVEKLSLEESIKMKEKCIIRASDFSLESFGSLLRDKMDNGRI
ncbi:MAG: glycosyl transferase group 1 [uncultured bacterium (gcode 4)]|uniref:Glycosyl transferase group 1 n=1 Tax=uncultured bacterium (gcode 4) TaxID=1234023 RepID=K2G0S8_9BACT|nr:MAG: glycosyl transferase group 1 [uncultured bacterium (gcode 4)]